ncbi:CDP-alcohol phosphatidyltransferase family protein [Patescibacteria group bacterium]
MEKQLNFKISQEVYPPEKEKANKETIWEYYFARKIAFLIAPIFIKTGISANSISFLSIAFGVAGAILIAFGNFWMILTGGMLMQIWLILDKTDGMVARFKKTTTKLGEFLEELNGSLTAILFFTSIGFAASKLPGFLPDFLKISPSLFIILSILTSFFVILRHLSSRHFEFVFRNKEGENGVSERGIIFNIHRLTIKFSGVYSLAQPIFILAAIFNFLGIYTLAYFLIQGTLMLANIFYLTVKASKK